MIIEIQGANFQNKGAELMLYAVIERLSQSLQGVQFAMSAQIGSYAERARYGLLQRITHGGGRASRLVHFFIRGGYRKRYGLVKDAEIDALLDVSGFAYGERWGADNIQALAARAGEVKERGGSVILLPQAFGPFSTPEIRKAFKNALPNIDLVFVRDRESLKYIEKLGGPFSQVKTAPDFTNLVEGRPPPSPRNEGRRACVIPNTHMIKSTTTEVKEHYIPFLVSCIRCLSARNLQPFILAHETRDDKDLIAALQSAAGQELEIVRESDPLAIKGIIGSSFVVVGSRYHGLVNAFSQAVPTMGTEWTHKYRCLFEDYGCPENLLPVSAGDEEIEARLDVLIHEPARSELISSLATAAETQKQKTREMWTEVETLLKASS